MSVSQTHLHTNKIFTNTLSYTTLFQTLSFMLILLILCTCARGIMVLHYIPQELWEHQDFYAMLFMGFKLDMRSIGIAMLIFVGLKLIAHIIESALKILSFLAGGGQIQLLKSLQP